MTKASFEAVLLPDVNVLLALAWPNHQFHAAAVRRMERSKGPWATCALTQLGFIRLSANPAAFSPSKTPAEAVALLEELVEDSRHVFIESLPPAVRPGSRALWGKILGHQQVTDAYLLMVAEAAGASLLTLDRRLYLLAGSDGRVETI